MKESDFFEKQISSQLIYDGIIPSLTAEISAYGVLRAVISNLP